MMSFRHLVAVMLLLSAAGPMNPLQADTLGDIAKRGALTIGFHENSPPFSFRDDTGGPVGYSVDLCRRISAAIKEELGKPDLKVEFKAVKLNNRIKAVRSGDIDIHCGSDTITLGRQEEVDFTLMTFVTGGALMSRANRPIKRTSDLSGKTVAVARGTTTAASLAAYLERALIDARVVEVETDDRAMGQLNAGEVDAVASDQIVLIGQVLQAGDPTQYTISEDLFSFEPYGLMVRQDDSKFRLVVNRALARLYRTAQYRQLYDRWFGRAGVRPTPILAAMYQLQAIPE